MNDLYFQVNNTVNTGTIVKAYAICLTNDEEAKKALAGMLPMSPFIMPCGNTYMINSVDELPDGDLMCPCGNPEHYFVKYIDVIDHRKQEP